MKGNITYIKMKHYLCKNETYLCKNETLLSCVIIVLAMKKQ